MATWTRMDLTAIYGGIAVKCWSGHWQEGSAPDYEVFREGVGIDQACLALEDGGWSVIIHAQRDQSRTAQALRGDSTRIDYYILATEIMVKHYPYGWKAGTRPIKTEHLPLPALEDLLTEREQRGWTVRRWPKGARAFKGAPLPVRNQREIMVLRHAVEQEFSKGEGTGVRNFNLAYDL